MGMFKGGKSGKLVVVLCFIIFSNVIKESYGDQHSESSL